MGHWHADNELSTLQLKWKIEKMNLEGQGGGQGVQGKMAALKSAFTVL